MQQDAPSPLDFYTQRAREVQLSAEQQDRRRAGWNSAWVLLGLLACVLLYESFYAKRVPFWPAIFPVAGFVFALREAQKCRDAVLQLVNLRDYYDKGIARLKHEWNSLDDGKDFADPAHIYASDLDLFGRGSIFQLLCSARTHIGRETLADWMKTPASAGEVLGRREAVSELRSRRELLECIASAGTKLFSDCRPGTFRNWLLEMSSRPPFLRWMAVAPLFLIAALLAFPLVYWAGAFSLQTLWVSESGVLVLEAIFTSRFRDRVRFILKSVQALSIELPTVCELLAIIERERFSAPKLVAIAKRLKGGKVSACGSLRMLTRRIWVLQQGSDGAVWLLTWYLMWGTQMSMAIDRWYRGHGADLQEYIGALGEFEALLSLATYSFEHPQDVFAEIAEARPQFDAQQLGHPLIDENVCVLNDVQLGNDMRFLIVSGSNMSGKSTFLRAIGANAMLALMGAPVRCASLRISELQIAAAIRVQDSVTEGRSHFLAEMQRLRQTIDLANKGPLLFLVDEIMSGTNSHDRRIAAEWVVRALVRSNAIGLLTTHDLTLTEIAANGLPGRNVYFEDSGEGGELKFDYKLHSGLLTHSNALNIARMLGIGTET